MKWSRVNLWRSVLVKRQKHKSFRRLCRSVPFPPEEMERAYDLLKKDLGLTSLACRLALVSNLSLNHAAHIIWRTSALNKSFELVLKDSWQQQSKGGKRMMERQHKIAEMLLSDIEQAEPGHRQVAVDTYRNFMVACEVAIRNETSK